MRTKQFTSLPVRSNVIDRMTMRQPCASAEARTSIKAKVACLPRCYYLKIITILQWQLY